MPEFKISTQTCLYDPIVINLEHPKGVFTKYTQRKITNPMCIILEPLEEAIQNNEAGAFSKWVTALYGIDGKILDKLATREIEDIFIFTAKILRERDTLRMKSTMSDLKETAQNVVDIQADTSKIEGVVDVEKVKDALEKNEKRPGEKDS